MHDYKTYLTEHKIKCFQAVLLPPSPSFCDIQWSDLYTLTSGAPLLAAGRDGC